MRTNPFEEGKDDKNHDEGKKLYTPLNQADLIREVMIFSDSRTNPFEEGEDDKNHGVPNGPIAKKIKKMPMPRRFKKMSIQKCQQHNSNLRVESSINFEPITLVTQTHQH